MSKRLTLVVAAEAAVLGAGSLYLGAGAIYESMRHWIPTGGEVKRVWAGEVTDSGDFRVGMIATVVGLAVMLPAIALIRQSMQASRRKGHENSAKQAASAGSSGP